MFRIVAHSDRSTFGRVDCVFQVCVLDETQSLEDAFLSIASSLSVLAFTFQSSLCLGKTIAG